MTDELKLALRIALKNAVLTASDDSVNTFISVLERFIDSKQPAPLYDHDTLYGGPTYDEVLYGDEQHESEYGQADDEYEQYMEARFGRWTD